MMEWLYILDLMGEILPDIIPEGIDPGLVGLVSGVDSAAPLDLSPIIESLAEISAKLDGITASLEKVHASLEYGLKDDLEHSGLLTKVQMGAEGVAAAIDTHSSFFQVWDSVAEENVPVLPLLLEELANIESDDDILEIGGNAIYLKSKIVRS
jgi:CO dehydrogenase/acetyl-CoA synthase alpha subunit